ncbi:bifunctional phosphoglucose/phosphomannose isomerase [Candidatus Giovannonibacteria bacterium RIFCSPHIGHO2_02_FULL_45_13]|uniref:Bifunctional phosphoglucose/phosphomannose isomerase n=1 Tax=Candidatus Giovannonibacteria bacterium RIFCSPHIGHO2_01_FULL_45_23 TaxID=1798325 RepID=A0A1F5VFH1_9BACT|nr:MAG: bifunctional phosphoglucose/phosphomannose isomerase [Candidatus Giovannonibacteria bacterium RIFCSPHIGHO2_01_FULL_45_23]OGF75309.1 MAG: bifunctional phosphoglucose/phosphomannose isomerase [Candidatus Giovannonibacteria bacterium RIFCSPHIGHO2_02_FULL_45_13]
MYESIKNFSNQFEFEPEIENAGKFKRYKNFVVCGMGGSALAGDLLKITNSKSQITIWRDYNLPKVEKDTLIIASSYSGNTEETIDAFRTALKRKLPLVAITTGGKLLELAKKYNTPYIQIPSAGWRTGIQPRMATGFMITALMKLMRLDRLLLESSRLPRRLNIKMSQRAGKALAEKLRGKIPIIYSSNKNFPIAYNWKIKFNETAKIPAFANVFPELNHNEMNGFSAKGPARASASGGDFAFIFLEDEADDQRIQKRMKITKKLYEGKKLEVRSLKLEGKNILHKIFQHLLIADWTAFYLAKYYGADPEQVPMVEEFKKMIK